MDKPKGIKVIAILILVFVGLSVLGTIQSLLVRIFLPSSSVQDISGYSTYLLIDNILTLVLEVFFIIGAIGLLRYKESGRKIVIITAIGDLLLSSGGMIYLGAVSGISLFFSITLVSAIIGIILYGLVIFYFSRKKVKEAFA